MSMDGKLVLQANKATFFELMAKDTRKDHYKGFDIGVLQSNLDDLERYWIRFEATHEKILGSREEDLMELDYIKTKVYEGVMKNYISAKNELISLIRRKDDSADISINAGNRVNQEMNQNTQSNKLPDIPLPRFSGEYPDWKPFRDLFKSMIMDNDSIAPVQKIIYLRSSLSGDALKAIINLQRLRIP